MNALLEAARGAWPFKQMDPIDMGVEDGIVWAVSPAPVMGVNGYVLIPAEGHPWSKATPSTEVTDSDGEYSYTRYATEDLEVHGGITYGECGGPGWIGFDAAHSGDVWDAEYDKYGLSDRLAQAECPWAKHWTLELLIEEAKSLARQVAAVSA